VLGSMVITTTIKKMEKTSRIEATFNARSRPWQSVDAKMTKPRIANKIEDRVNVIKRKINESTPKQPDTLRFRKILYLNDQAKYIDAKKKILHAFATEIRAPLNLRDGSS
jgi:hypothetical protein